MNSPDIASYQPGIAVATVYVMDWLKRAQWFPLMTRNTETVNRIVSMVVALSSVVVLKVAAVHGDMSNGGTITLTFPPLAVIFDTLVHAGAQFGGQEVLHKLLGNHSMDKLILQELSGLRAKLQIPPSQ